ncbi:MAG: HlyC/CorC family transporter [Solirubrobacterales bacterium]|nr:HlyC/CorC family transporter [Solirubrobacterales bacterium]
MALDLIVTFLLVFANGFFVATEFAITRLRPTQVADFERERRPGAKSVRHAVEHIDAYLSACQLGITLASIGLGVVGKPVFEELLEPVLGSGAAVGSVALAAAVAFGIVTLLHVVVGELAPKSFAIARTARASLLLAPPMRVFYLLTRPVVDLFNAMGNLLLKPFGIPPAREVGHSPLSEEELRQLLRQSAAEGLIEAEEGRFSENVLLFGDLRAREVMVPRGEVAWVTAEDSIGDVARRSIETGHTRLPLCEADAGLDEPLGVIHAKDLLPALVEPGEPSLRDLARPLARVSESILLDQLLRDLRREHAHIALVVDEHGTVIGLVTLEDIIEEIVGEIEDEFDAAHAELIGERDGLTVVAGAAPLRLVAERLGVEVDDPHEATIGGHVVELLGRVPAVGETVVVDGHRLEVTGVDETRVAELALVGESAQAADGEREPGEAHEGRPPDGGP